MSGRKGRVSGSFEKTVLTGGARFSGSKARTLRRYHLWLKDIFSRQNPRISVSDAPTLNAEGLTNDVLEEMTGISSPWQMPSWLSLVAFLVPSVIVAAFFFGLKDSRDSRRLDSFIFDARRGETAYPAC